MSGSFETLPLCKASVGNLDPFQHFFFEQFGTTGDACCDGVEDRQTGAFPFLAFCADSHLANCLQFVLKPIPSSTGGQGSALSVELPVVSSEDIVEGTFDEASFSHLLTFDLRCSVARDTESC